MNPIQSMLIATAWLYILVPWFLACALAFAIKWPRMATNVGFIISVLAVFTTSGTPQGIVFAMGMAFVMLEILMWFANRKDKKSESENSNGKAKAFARALVSELQRSGTESSKLDGFLSGNYTKSS